MDIAPGKKVTIEIKATPSTPSGRKTLVRICAKDPAMRKLARSRKAKRPSWQEWQRGGRLWHHQMRSAAPVQLSPGRRYAVLATLDVIRDLASIERWVTVTPH